MPHDEDWAIVVGIANYPDLGDLGSPENDARAFYNWVTTRGPGGGGVPLANSKLILSSHFAGAKPFPLGMTPPTIREIETELIRLAVIAEQNGSLGQGHRVGRRLYLYFSGHGCAPKRQETAILMANATRQRVYHLTGEPCADWFFFAGYFDEIVLLMDCCSERYENVGMYFPPWMEINLDDAVDKSRKFYGFATKWSKLARERPYPPPNGLPRSVFTLALLDGLAGAAFDTSTQFLDPQSGKQMAHVTAISLANFLYNHMKDYLSTEDQKKSFIAKEPELIFHPVHGRNLVFATVEVPVYSVTIRVPAKGRGKKLQIRIEGFKVFKEWQVAPANVVVSLPRGLYEARIVRTHLEQTFEVTGSAGGNDAVCL